jgi:hypothetical protein
MGLPAQIAQAMDEVTGAYWGATVVVSRDKTKRRSVHAILLYKAANGSDKGQITKTVRAFLLHAPTLKHLANCNTTTVRIDQTDDMVFPATEKQQSEIFGQIYRDFHEASRA